MHVYIDIYTCVCVCARVCVYICVCVYVCVCGGRISTYAYACAAANHDCDHDDDDDDDGDGDDCFPCFDFILISTSTCNDTSVQGRPCVQKSPFTQ